MVQSVDDCRIGKPNREILELAAKEEIDLIVMGVRGRNPLDLTLLDRPPITSSDARRVPY